MNFQEDASGHGLTVRALLKGSLARLLMYAVPQGKGNAMPQIGRYGELKWNKEKPNFRRLGKGSRQDSLVSAVLTGEVDSVTEMVSGKFELVFSLLIDPLCRRDSDYPVQAFSVSYSESTLVGVDADWETEGVPLGEGVAAIPVAALRAIWKACPPMCALIGHWNEESPDLVKVTIAHYPGQLESMANPLGLAEPLSAISEKANTLFGQ